MLRNVVIFPLFYCLIGLISLPIYGQTYNYNYHPNYPSYQNHHVPINDNYNPSNYRDNQDENELVYRDRSDDTELQRRAFRMGDWDYKENWRYNRDAFLRGESQPQAYRDRHPYGSAGIGYDGDYEYVDMRRNLQRYNREHNHQYYRNNYYNSNGPYYNQNTYRPYQNSPNNHYDNDHRYISDNDASYYRNTRNHSNLEYPNDNHRYDDQGSYYNHQSMPNGNGTSYSYPNNR